MKRFAALAFCALAATAVGVEHGLETTESALNALSAQLATTSSDDDDVLAHLLSVVDQRFKVEQATAHQAFMEQNEFCRAKTLFLLRRESELREVAQHIEKHSLRERHTDVVRAKHELEESRHQLHSVERDLKKLDAEEAHGEKRAFAEQARLDKADDRVEFGLHNVRIVKSLLPAAEDKADPTALLRAFMPSALLEVSAGGDGTEGDVASRQTLLRTVMEDLEASLHAHSAHMSRAAKAHETAAKDDATVLNLERSVLQKARKEMEESFARAQREVADAKADVDGSEAVLSQALLARHMVHQRRQLLVHGCEAFGAAFETASHYRARLASQIGEAQFFLSHNSRTTNLAAYLRGQQQRFAEAEAAVHAAVERQNTALKALATERDRIFHPAIVRAEATGATGVTGATGNEGAKKPAAAAPKEAHGEAHADEPAEKQATGPAAAKEEEKRVYVPPYVKPVGRPTGGASVNAFRASVTGATGSSAGASSSVRSVEEATSRVMQSVAAGRDFEITTDMLGGMLATGAGAGGKAPTGAAAMTSDGVVVLVRAAVVKGLADGAAADADKAGLLATVRAEVTRAMSAYLASVAPHGELAYDAVPESGATEILAGPYAEYTPAVLEAVDSALAQPRVAAGSPTEIVAAVMTAAEAALDAAPTGATGIFVRGHYETVPVEKEEGPVAAKKQLGSRPALKVAAAKAPAATAAHAVVEEEEEVEEEIVVAQASTASTGATGFGVAVMPEFTVEEEEEILTAQHRLQGAADQAATDAARVEGKVTKAVSKLEDAERTASADATKAEAALEEAKEADAAVMRASARAVAARKSLEHAMAAEESLQTEASAVENERREARAAAERAEQRAMELEALAARVRELVMGMAPKEEEVEETREAVKQLLQSQTGATGGLFLPGAPATGGAPTDADIAAALKRVTLKHGHAAGGSAPAFGYDDAAEAVSAGAAGAAAGGSSGALLELAAFTSPEAEEAAVRESAARLGVSLPKDLSTADSVLQEAAAAATHEATREEEKAVALKAKAARIARELEEAEESVVALKRSVAEAEADAVKAAKESHEVDSDEAEAEAERTEAVVAHVAAEIKAQKSTLRAAQEAADRLQTLALEAEGATGMTGVGATGAVELVREGKAVMQTTEAEMADIREEFEEAAGKSWGSEAPASTAADMLEASPEELEAEASLETGTTGGATGGSVDEEVTVQDGRTQKELENERLEAAEAEAWAAAWAADKTEEAAEARREATEEKTASATGSAASHREAVDELLREAYAQAHEAHKAHRDVESPKSVQAMAAAIDAEAEKQSEETATGSTGAASTGGASTAAEAGEASAPQSAEGSVGQTVVAGATGGAVTRGTVGVIHFAGHEAEEGDMCLQLSGATNQHDVGHSGYLELWERMAEHGDAQRWLHREDHALCLADHPASCLSPSAAGKAFGVSRHPLATVTAPGSAQLGASADFAGFRLRGTSVDLVSTDVATWTFTPEGRLCLATRRELCLTVQGRAGNDVAVVLEKATEESKDVQTWLFDTA